MSVPVLRMGLVGFEDTQYLRNLLMTRTQGLRWAPWSYVNADALWINGAHAQPLRNHLVRIPQPDFDGIAAVLNLKELSRPAAFTLPLGNGYLNPERVFDPRAADSVLETFLAFESALHQLTVQLALAGEIAERRYELRSPTYHLSLDGVLVGIVNVTGEIGLLETLPAAALAGLHWSGRPGRAGEIPRHFTRTSMAHVMWQHLLRSGDDLLPTRYRESMLYYKRMPPVSPSMLSDIHLFVIAELERMPQNLEQLMQGTGLAEYQLVQALACLYFAGSITANSGKAPAAGARPAPRCPADDSGSRSSPLIEWLSRSSRQKGYLNTVPSPLGAY